MITIFTSSMLVQEREFGRRKEIPTRYLIWHSIRVMEIKLFAVPLEQSTLSSGITINSPPKKASSETSI